MAKPKSVLVTEDDEYYSLVFQDDLRDAVLTDTEPDVRVVTMAIGLKKTESEGPSGERQVDVAIAEVKFPKQLYNREDVAKTAGVLDKAIKEGECAPCVILSTTDATKKTYKLGGVIQIPTWRDLVGVE